MIGAGGHASVLMEILQQQNRRVIAYISPDKSIYNQIFSGLEHIYNDEDITLFSPNDVTLINGVGSLPNSALRKKVSTYFSSLGYRFASVISPSAVISKTAVLAQNVQVLNGAIIQARAKIGEHCIVNTGAIVEHDCIVGDNNHLAPRSTLCGGVITAEDVHVGVHACVIQAITLGSNVVVGAGAVVTKPVANNCIVYGPRALIVQKE